MANKPDPKPVLTRMLFEAALFSAMETEGEWEDDAGEVDEDPDFSLLVEETSDTLTVDTVVDSIELSFWEVVELDSLASAPTFLAAVPETVVTSTVVVEPTVAFSVAVVVESVSLTVAASPLETVVATVVTSAVSFLVVVSAVSSVSHGTVVVYV